MWSRHMPFVRDRVLPLYCGRLTCESCVSKEWVNMDMNMAGFKDIKADEMGFLLRSTPNLEHLNVK